MKLYPRTCTATGKTQYQPDDLPLRVLRRGGSWTLESIIAGDSGDHRPASWWLLKTGLYHCRFDSRKQLVAALQAHLACQPLPEEAKRSRARPARLVVQPDGSRLSADGQWQVLRDGWRWRIEPANEAAQQRYRKYPTGLDYRRSPRSLREAATWIASLDGLL